MENKKLIGYWEWFFRGSGGSPGYRRILNRWLFLHLCIGMVLAYYVPLNIRESANSVLLPLAGILIGLAFAWAGNAQALLQTKELEEFSKYHKGGFAEYVFVYQTAILVMLVTLVSWGLGGLEIYDSFLPPKCNPKIYIFIKMIIFTLSSLALRECWQVVSGAHWLLRIRKEISEKMNKDIK